MITSLSLTHFRSHTQSDFTLSPTVNAFIAPNGSGKTNVLEAIRIVSTGTSWRSASNISLIKHGQAEGSIAVHTNEDAFQVRLEGTKKKLLRNDKSRSWKAHLRAIPSVLFAPEMMTLFSGDKRSRQRYFDTVLFQLRPDILPVYTQTQKLLQQKQAELRQEVPNKTLLSSYNALLSPLIPTLFQARREMCTRLLPRMKTALDTITGGAEELGLGLAVAEWDLKTDIDRVLEQILPREMAARRCFVGPHRDDFVLLYRSRPVMETVSRGELRSLLLSLLTAIRQVLEEDLGQPPLLLLDDVFSELDDTRQSHLAALCAGCQCFITSTHKEHLKGFESPKIYPI